MLDRAGGAILDKFILTKGFVGKKDDCIVDRVVKQRIYIVATNDRDLKRRIRKIPGVPVISVARGKYVVERLPSAPEK